MGDFEVPPLEHTPWPTPSRAIYGFVLYVSTYVIFGMYMLWALLPDSCLHALGLTYIPARHWVITFPFLVCFGVAFTVCVYVIRNWLDTPDVEDLDTFTDEFQRVLPEEDLDLPVGAIPPIGDFSLKRVSKLHHK
ncbi:phosphatidylinositol N-acetylglucosaminyltransferase subunit P-like [Hydractinia symbiolongicarpus]|uniref:phosphatidylinositol N-acetylglucosaminyltransferase subunit P-like n=1 Tax=Hydractinia symbiolongicarpus TaxID=13093 RepID=UPI00254F34CF|nr:phosphatidylinositol N-acetylglucosaminyltransferase subunit P-like [Hydractinia symbiolongicarpus]